MRKIVSVIWELIERIILTVLKVLFRLLKKELTDETFEAIMQFVKFGFVGLSNTVLAYVVYVVSLLAFRWLGILSDNGYLIAQVISFVISVLWSFCWNNRLVFTLREGEERSIVSSLIKTFISYSFTGLFLNSVLLALWVRVLHISEIIAPIINIPINVPINFIINKFWAFKNKD